MNKLKKILTKTKSREALFFVLAAIMIAISAWFIFSSYIFLIKNLNDAFSSEPTVKSEQVSFDKEGFQKLNLLKER
jgi:hypothetical protein